MFKRLAAVFAGMLGFMLLTLMASLLIEEGIIPEDTEVYVTANLTLIGMLFCYIVLDMIREILGTLWTERKANVLLGVFGAAFFVYLAITLDTGADEIWAGIASWSLILAVVISSHTWGPVLEERVGPRLEPYLNQS